MIEKLIARIFCTRNYAHIQHWATESYAEHVALSDFYTDILNILDTFVEMYQGNYKKIEACDCIDEECMIQYDDILKQLQDDVKWLDKNYDKLCSDLTPLKNTLDELLGVYLKTIYKLRFLD